MNGSASSREFWLLGLGYVIWCSALVLVYALHGIGCAFNWQVGTLRLALAATLVSHLALIAVLWGRTSRRSPDLQGGETSAFLQWVLYWTLVTAFVVTVLTLAPVLLLSTCI